MFSTWPYACISLSAIMETLTCLRWIENSYNLLLEWEYIIWASTCAGISRAIHSRRLMADGLEPLTKISLCSSLSKCSSYLRHRRRAVVDGFPSRAWWEVSAESQGGRSPECSLKHACRYINSTTTQAIIPKLVNSWDYGLCSELLFDPWSFNISF